jgi:hypothetical protein
MVNKDTIQPNESRDRPPVGPGIATIRQRELNQAEGIDGVVKESCFVEGEVVVVTVCRVTSEIEVPDNDPGNVIARLVGGKRFQKRNFRAPLTRGIHIRETEDRRVIIHSEIQREDVAGGELVREGKEVMVPGRENATGCTDSIYRTVRTNTGMEKGCNFRGRQGGQILNERS